MELVEFLLARIAEDEADAMVGWRWKALPAGEYARLQARVLAECDAKRRIVVGAQDYSPELSDGDNGEWAFDWVLRCMALPYADHHPDYREDWKP